MARNKPDDEIRDRALVVLPPFPIAGENLPEPEIT